MPCADEKELRGSLPSSERITCPFGITDLGIQEGIVGAVLAEPDTADDEDGAQNLKRRQRLLQADPPHQHGSDWAQEAQ